MSRRSVFLQFQNIHLADGPHLYKGRLMWYFNFLFELLQIEIISSQLRDKSVLSLQFFFIIIFDNGKLQCFVIPVLYKFLCGWTFSKIQCNRFLKYMFNFCLFFFPICLCCHCCVFFVIEFYLEWQWRTGFLHNSYNILPSCVRLPILKNTRKVVLTLVVFSDITGHIRCLCLIFLSNIVSRECIRNLWKFFHLFMQVFVFLYICM